MATTDTTTRYEYDGYGEVGDNLTVAGVPAGIFLAPIRRVHHSLPAPTLVDGRPT